GDALATELAIAEATPMHERRAARRAKFRQMGVWLEPTPDDPTPSIEPLDEVLAAANGGEPSAPPQPSTQIAAPRTPQLTKRPTASESSISPSCRIIQRTIIDRNRARASSASKRRVSGEEPTNRLTTSRIPVISVAIWMTECMITAIAESPWPWYA